MGYNKAFLEAYKDQKGIDGEDTVEAAIYAALKLCEIKFYKVYRDVVIQFPSVFGSYYGMTTEIDHIVVTKEFIFILETKNHEDYRKIEPLYWELINGEKIISPIEQNIMHKLVLASELKIKRESIKTIECFNKISNFNYANEYMFARSEHINIQKFCHSNNEILSYNSKEFVKNLAYLFISKNSICKFDYEGITSKIDELTNKQKIMRFKEKHLENVESANEILKAQKGNYEKLEYTDVGQCPYCGQNTIKLIRFKPELEPGQKRRKYAYRTCFVCINFNCYKYNKSQGEFDEDKIIISEGYPKTKKLIGSNIQIKTIQERTGITSMEKFVDTIKNHIDDLNRQIDVLKSKNYELESSLNKATKELEELRNSNWEKYNKIAKIDNELCKYKPKLFGLFYIKTK